ncbi:hypothetical protein NIES267_65660 [Calothrix parasitica NIES-267]|uniref:Uncharacterized protein n=1 Tax=Calothrix parasitica NIES-267 TaxID=1973488 RepID=A0A1Z4M0R0_9CYAN|nr:hypothetical protein NIES267_65660 [Calothrix parasitica NIES-267]
MPALDSNIILFQKKITIVPQLIKKKAYFYTFIATLFISYKQVKNIT